MDDEIERMALYRLTRLKLNMIREILGEDLEKEFIYKYGSSYGFGYQYLREQILKVLDGGNSFLNIGYDGKFYRCEHGKAYGIRCSKCGEQ